MIITDDQVKSAYNYAYTMQKVNRFFDEDIVQEGMLRFVEIMTDTGEFKLAIVGLRNRIKDCLRSKRNRAKIEIPAGSSDDMKSLADIIVEPAVIEDQATFEQVYKLIMESANQKERAVIIEYLKGYNFNEIAMTLKIKPGNARLNFHRIVQKTKALV